MTREIYIRQKTRALQESETAKIALADFVARRGGGRGAHRCGAAVADAGHAEARAKNR